MLARRLAPQSSLAEQVHETLIKEPLGSDATASRRCAILPTELVGARSFGAVAGSVAEDGRLHLQPCIADPGADIVDVCHAAQPGQSALDDYRRGLQRANQEMSKDLCKRVQLHYIFRRTTCNF